MHKRVLNTNPLQSVKKPLAYLKMGSQGRSPRQGLGTVVPFKNGVAGAKPPTGTRDGSPSKIAPFRGKGFGDRDNKSEVYFKNRLFLQVAAGS